MHTRALTAASLACLEREAIHVVRRSDTLYPLLLREILPMPDTLYVRGTNIPTNRPLLAIVGTRRSTLYGLRVLEQFIPLLVQAGVGIISGLAMGIDAHAHRLTVQHQGYTAAVLPGGCDSGHIFPRNHQRLAEEILAHGGTLLSEHPPHTNAYKSSFPIRNRIIAGISHATLVIEAPAHSGALITARHALEYNRIVAAIPGPIHNEMSIGTNALLKSGAYVITDAQDILDIFGLTVTPKIDKPIAQLSADYQAILRKLSSVPLHIDEIIRQTQLPQSEIIRIITTLEIQGFVADVGGKRYIRDI